MRRGAFFCVPGAGDLLAVHFPVGLCGTLFPASGLLRHIGRAGVDVRAGGAASCAGKKREGGTEGSKQRGGIGKDFSGDNDSDRRNFYSDCHSIGIFVPDVRDLLSGRQFVVMLLLLSPYGYWGLRFFGGLLRGTRGRKRWTYVLCAVGGVCPAILWTAAGDYSRAVFYGFVGVILPALCLTALGDAFFVAHVRGMKEEIRKVLPIPAVFVLYPLIFITFWMMGWESIPAEEILKLQ